MLDVREKFFVGGDILVDLEIFEDKLFSLVGV